MTTAALRLFTGVWSTKSESFSRPDIKPVFILSSGRTGTNFFADHFNNYDKVLALHEPKPYWQLRLWSHAYYEGKISKKTMRSVLYRLRQKSFAKLESPIYLEANPALTGFADVLHDVYANSSVIHIVRDPRDYIKSSLNQGTSKGLKGLMNRVVPYWYVKYKPEDGSHSDKDMLFRVANYWRVVNENLIKLANSKHPYELYRFEDLFDKSNGGLRKISKSLGLEFKPDQVKRVNQSNKKIRSSWSNWTDEEIQKVNEICSPLMQKFGYGNEPQWIERSK